MKEIIRSRGKVCPLFFILNKDKRVMFHKVRQFNSKKTNKITKPFRQILKLRFYVSIHNFLINFKRKRYIR